MKRLVLMAVMLSLAGCGKPQPVTHQVSAVLEADLAGGNAILTCRESSSGSCHILFVTGSAIERISAQKGETATASGLSAQTQYCLQESAPQNGCRLRPLVQGEQIVRNQSTHTE